MPSYIFHMPSDAHELPANGMQITIAPLPNGQPASPGPDKIITGHVAVPEASLRGADRIVLQHRGVEVVGGTLDDYEDSSLDGLVPKKGARALNRLYFDERLVLWQRGEDAAAAAAGSNGMALLPFSIAYPNANYPSQVRSVSKSAPSQSFEIAYHIVAWLADADNGPVARAVHSVPFVPVYGCKSHIVSSQPPPPPVSQAGFDDRGRESLLTRVTLSQADYAPGDQVVAGVYIECTKANRTVRKAECTLRQRVECRMRRTFGPAESAEIASSSRPQSSQPSSASDDSDVLWSRIIDVGPTQPLTLTTSGVGLAAAAAGSGAAAQQLHHAAGSVNGSPSVSDAGSEMVDKRDSGFSRSIAGRSPSIIAGFRSCTANMHTSIPDTAPMVSGHFLLFSYELQIDVTIGSIARGSQKIATRTQLAGGGGGAGCGAATPTSTSGLTLSRLSARHRALAEAHASSGCVSATAACFPQSALQTPPNLFDAREMAELRRSRFSYGGAQTSSPHPEDGAAAADAQFSSNGAGEAGDARRFSSLGAGLARRDFSATSESQMGAFAELPNVDELPNAVEQLRYRCAASLALMPKIFDPSRPAVDSASADPDTTGAAAVTPAATDMPSTEGASDSDTGATEGAGKAFIGTAKAAAPAGDTADADPEQLLPAGDGGPGKQNVAGATPSERESESSGSGEDDLARAVQAAAEKVINDKVWERPDSCLQLPPKKSAKGKGTSGTRARQKVRRASSSDDSLPMFDAEEGDSVVEDGARSSRSSSESSHYSRMDRDEIEDAINRLAPIKQDPGLRIDTGELNDMMQGMEFFDSQDAGPELTGLLSADPNKMTFGELPLNSLMAAAAAAEPAAIEADAAAVAEAGARDESEPAAEATAEAASETVVVALDSGPKGDETPAAGGRAMARNRVSARFGWKMLTPPPQPPQQITSVLRRSISMPSGTSTDSTGSAELRQAADAVDSSETTVAQSAHEASEYKSVLVRKSRLSGVSPSSVLSVMSSTSRLGATSRANVLRTIGHRMSSWFSKK